MLTEYTFLLAIYLVSAGATTLISSLQVPLQLNVKSPCPVELSRVDNLESQVSRLAKEIRKLKHSASCVVYNSNIEVSLDYLCCWLRGGASKVRLAKVRKSSARWSLR